MAGKTKGGTKNKAKAKKANGDAAAVPDGKGCRACNFTGEVCRECGEPHTGCECKTFAPVVCPACDPAAMASAEHQPESEQLVASEPLDGNTFPIGGPATEEPPAGYETADQPPGPEANNADDADDQGLAKEETEATFPATPSAGELITEATARRAQEAANSHDPELEKLVAESVQRRLHRFKTGNRRRHHTNALSIRVLSGIIKAGEAAAQGGADGFFGRWCRNDLMAWEGLMDAAEWAMEELNARECRRMKRESTAANKSQETAAATS